MKSLILNTFLLSGSFLFALVGAELALNIADIKIPYQYAPQKIEMSHFQISDVSEVTLQKNFSGNFTMSLAPFESKVETNSLGWRDKEPDARKQVLVFGDSFIFGNGLNNNETIPTLLENLNDKKVDFVNLGYTSGRSPDAYANYLKKHKSLQNKETIVSIYTNDLHDISLHEYIDSEGKVSKTYSSDTVKMISPTVHVRDGRLFLSKNRVNTTLPVSLLQLMKRSYLVGFLRDRLSNSKSHEQAAQEIAQNKPTASINMEALENMKQSLLDIKNLSKELVVVAFNSKGGGEELESYKAIREFCEANGISYLSIPSLNDNEYWANDAHYNPAGAKRAASLINRFIPRTWVEI